MKRKCASGLLLALLMGMLTNAPASDAQSLFEAISSSNRFTILVSAVKESGQVKSLTEAGKNTLFAPTDEAFRKLGDDELKSLIADKQRLRKLVKAHIVTGTNISSEMLSGSGGKDINGFVISAKKDDMRIGSAKIAATDLEYRNGVMHEIDTVLIPK